MTAQLIVWLVSLGSVFGVGFAAGRASRRPAIVNFPEFPALRRISPTVSEVAHAMRASEETEKQDGKV